jgi:hypothetical protein
MLNVLADKHPTLMEYVMALTGVVGNSF